MILILFLQIISDNKIHLIIFCIFYLKSQPPTSAVVSALVLAHVGDELGRWDRGLQDVAERQATLHPEAVGPARLQSPYLHPLEPGRTPDRAVQAGLCFQGAVRLRRYF